MNFQFSTKTAAGNTASAQSVDTLQAGRLWDDFGNDDTDEEPETTASQSASQQQPAPSSSGSTSQSFGDVIETLSSFGKSTAPTQVLVLSPTAHSVTNDIFTEITTAETAQNVVFVSAVQSPGNQLPMVSEFPDWVTGNSTLIEVGQQQSGQQAMGRPPDAKKEIPNPQNLAKLGVVISHEIGSMNNQYPTVLAFHTLSSIEQYLGTERIVPFLYTLTSKCSESGVMGYCHLDPNRHSTDTVESLKSIFDVTVTVAPNGEIDVE